MSATSSFTAMAPLPAASAAAAQSATSPATMRAPAAPSARAYSNPNPRAAPVINTTLPSTDMAISFLQCRCRERSDAAILWYPLEEAQRRTSREAVGYENAAISGRPSLIERLQSPGIP